MAKYVVANPGGYVALKYQPQQFAFLQALAARNCPACARSWQMQFSVRDSLLCPRCGEPGERDYNRFLLLAGRQSGKTRVGTLAAVLEASMPDSYGWVTAPTYRDLTDFVEPAFFGQLPQQWLDQGDWNVSDRLLVLPNRARIAFRSLENPEAMRGPTLDWYLMDEACMVASRAHQVGNATLAIKRGVAIYTTTPKGEDWVYEDIWMSAENHEPGFWAATWTSLENPVMDPAYVEAQRRQMSPEMFRQEFEAGIVTFQGAIYGAGLIDPCVIDDTTTEGKAFLRELIPEWPSINSSRTCVVGLDPGSDHPFAGVPYIVTPRGLVIFDEYEEREKPAIVHAANLKRMVGALQPRWGYDRSQAQMAIELAQHGIFAAPAENAVVAGIERVKSWMVARQIFFVKSRTKKLVSALKSYRWKETEKKDGSTGIQEPYKRKDDLCDALRYAVMLWPHLPAVPEVDTSVRDLSKLSEKTAFEITRMLRHEKVEKEKAVEGLGDFYGSDDADSAYEVDSIWS